MKLESDSFGAAHELDVDADYDGSRFAEVRHALFNTAYYRVWGAPDERPLPVYGVTLGRVLNGVFGGGRKWNFLQAARRAVSSASDMRWGMNGRGFRRLLHPNAVCLFGRWIIDQPNGYTGCFEQGTEALVVGRYSTCCTEVRKGRTRSLSLVGKVYPTTNPDHPQPLQTANFITQEDIGGARTAFINDAVLRNAPDVTPWRRGWGLPILFATGVAFKRSDREPTIRQLHQLAELGKPRHVPTNAPAFMQLKVSQSQPQVDREDFRDEVLGHIYDPGDPEKKRTLVFDIEVADRAEFTGWLVKRRRFESWTRIGRIEFDEAVAGYNGDFVLHFQHPRWRSNANDPSTATGP